MATFLLRAAGTAIGGLLGPVGAVIGSAIGSVAGYTIDQALINSTRHIEGSRLTGAKPMTAEDGAAIQRAYGYARLSTTVIWATQFEEKKTTKRQGAKGGPSVTSYSYYGNVALGLCEGKIAGIKRVWADGKELDLRDIEYRVYVGDEEQQPDPLIEAKQGSGNSPAYRGLAYIVFERLPLESFGNRIPQIQVEVIKPVGKLEQQVRAVTILPGATEHGLSPKVVTVTPSAGKKQEVNRHIMFADSDWHASIDELQAVFPNLEHVSLVVAWFANDLRAGETTIRPGVIDRDGYKESIAWQVSGLTRASDDVHVVGQINGKAVYGGTPNDQSVIDAITDLKARGLKVALNPFILMDVLSDNDLPDPYSDANQTAFPWRGRITCYPAPGRTGTVDQTAAARSQIEAFVGGDVDSAQFGYRRFILHYAELAELAGGVDTIIIGSEMRGLTTIRDQNNAFPFVEALKQLATDVAQISHPDAAVVYGADWSEYFGYHPQDGSGDVYFHLDPLWADPNITAIGIDNYMPLSDWRATDSEHGNANPDGSVWQSDLDIYKAAIAGGEGFDWYYASSVDRANRTRTPISDGAYNKPWVFRYKDLKSWWENPHYNRVSGVEEAQPTQWIPQSKPFWMMEIGCPAIHNGAVQPNVFFDEKSSESALPYFSNGSRDDVEQRVHLQAHHEYWSSVDDRNPVSQVDQRQMVDPSRLYIWAWDARPLPAFPLNQDYWDDGENWMRGHWINGRVGTAPAGDLIESILADHEVREVDTSRVRGASTGLLIGNPASARGTLEPLLQLFGAAANDMCTNEEVENAICFRALADYNPISIPSSARVDLNGQPLSSIVLSQVTERPNQIVLNYRNSFNNYAASTFYSRRLDEGSSMQIALDVPSILEQDQAAILSDQMLSFEWAGKLSGTFRLPMEYCQLACGDVVSFDNEPNVHWLIQRVTLTEYVTLEVRSINKPKPVALAPSLPLLPSTNADQGYFGAPPHIVTMDLPLIDGATVKDQLRVATVSQPQAAQSIYISPLDYGYDFRQTVEQNATIGSTVNALPTSFSGRWDYGSYLDVALISGAFESREDAFIFAGYNALAVKSEKDIWEIIQFANAEEIEPDVWRLSKLLRGQLGTEDGLLSGVPAGADVVLLDDTVVPIGLSDAEIGLELNARIGPSGKEFTDRYFNTVAIQGGLRSQLPLAPVHLTMSNGGSELQFSWIRRSRLKADNWLPADIPLGEDTEEYQVTILNAAGDEVLQRSVSETSLTVQHSEIGNASGEVVLRVVQISQQVGEGVPAQANFTIT